MASGDGDRFEPVGRWWGTGVANLGLAGLVEPEAFIALLAGRHPTTDALLGRRYNDASARGFDPTFSAPKSVSVLWVWRWACSANTPPWSGTPSCTPTP